MPLKNRQPSILAQSQIDPSIRITIPTLGVIATGSLFHVENISLRFTMTLEKFSVFNTLNIFIDRLMVENKIKGLSTDPEEEESFTMVIVTTVFTTKML